MIFSLYFPILLSLSLSFLIHAFKKHIHSFLGLATTFNTSTNIATDNYNLKRHHPIISSTAATTHVLESAKPPPVPLPPSSLIDERSMACTTESIGFESIDEMRVHDDQVDENDDSGGGDNNNNDEYEDDCWRRTSFPPPLSSLNGNGQPSFILLPVRKNGRLQLSKARINRPEILYATRQDGRLRLYLVPDQGILDDDDDVEEQEECEDVAEEEEQELVEDVAEEEEETTVESEEEEEVVEETRYEEEEDRVREWKKFHNERFKRCHEVVNHVLCHHVHGSHHNLHMYGVGIA